MDTVDRIFALVDAKYPEQRFFANDIGATPSRVSEWRRRKSASYTKPGMLAKIAEVLDTTVEYLLTGKEEAKKDPLPANGKEILSPKGYDTLTPAERAMVDRLVADLIATRSEQ